MAQMMEKIKKFKELYDKQELVNLTILTEDGGRFQVHMELIILFSGYFERLIFSEELEQPYEVVVNGLSKETMATIIDFIYSTTLDLRQDKVKEVVAAAEMLSIPTIIELCKSFLESKLSAGNCISVYNFSKHYFYNDLKEAAKKFMLLNFETIYTSNPQFVSLTSEDMKSLLTADTLNVKNEESAFMAVLKWVESDISNKSVHLPTLIQCLRAGLCDPKFFEEKIWPNELITKNEECQHFLFQASQLFADLQAKALADEENGTQRLEMFDVNHPFLRPRVPNEIIFVMGGWSAGSATNMIETYDVNTKRWFLSLFQDTIPRAYHGMVWHKKRIYVIGGFDGNQCYNSVHCFDPVTHAWEERGCMYVQRCYVSVTTLGNYIYAMGGYDGHRRSRSCERYDPENNQWSMLSNMISVRSDASAASLQGKIYVAGGFNGAQVLNSVECYNPETNRWDEVTMMNSPRSGVKMVAYRNFLFAMGGFNGTNRLASVERYDRVTKQWNFVTPMLGPRSNFATVVQNGLVYAIGGFNGLATVPTAEIYDPQTNNWTQTTDLNLNRSALAACTVTDISTASEYCYIGAHS